ncbi:MAG: hypothetical protein AMXMBFR58_12000 [Phycisphaerae bacterium]
MKSAGRWSGLFAACLLAVSGRAQTALEKGFTNPPDSAKPHTWWHWMNGNITAEGITLDLEAMKAVGLGGAQIFNVSESIPDGGVKIMSPEWRRLVQHAVSEADRLGLELCMHNCSGWSSSGGPWIPPEHAMKRVTSATLTVKGGGRVREKLPQPPTNLDWYRDIAVLAFPTPAAPAKIEDLNVKSGIEYRYHQQPATGGSDGAVRRNSVVDLSAKLGADGSLDWEAPAGAWTIIRIGQTLTGARNAPSPESGRGLECDKLSREALEVHWAGMMGPVIKDLGPLAGKTLNDCLIDSYEMGGQNWTDAMRKEFQARRGYDLQPFLPVLAGVVVDSVDVSERFLWDFRRTIADLFSDNYYTKFVELCHASGMSASIEPYDGPFECSSVGRDADIPMGEFWIGSGESPSCKLAASVGHTNGRMIIGAESFTAVPEVGRWLNDPYGMKSVGDLMFTVGINRYIIHRYAHQPWKDLVPGMTMGQWGTHFERTITWWDQAPAWTGYLARCQFMLQQGLFVADACFFAGDAAPIDAPMQPAFKAAGYDYDVCGTDVLMKKFSVRDGRLVLPDGMSYQLLVLPPTEFMTPSVVTRVWQLVQDGATVIGPRPSRSPSLTAYPEADTLVQTVAGELWGEAGQGAVDRRVGKGRVISGKSPDQVLAEAGIVADCSFRGASGKIAWIHRRAGDADIYFLSNQAQRSQRVECSFRIAGKQPELWHADTGTIEPAALWSSQPGTTTVTINFDPAGSVFVVFRAAPATKDHAVAVAAPPGDEPPPTPTVEVHHAAYEAVDGAGGADVTAVVAAMVKTGQLSIPASNSTFGDPAYMHRKQLKVAYSVDGDRRTRAVDENAVLELVEPPPDVRPVCTIRASNSGTLELRAAKGGTYSVKMAKGEPRDIAIESVPDPLPVTGPWTVTFQPGRGAPAGATFDRLLSWTDHGEPGIRYFSGTAEYTATFEIPPKLISRELALELELGRVKNIAEVLINGEPCGTLWKPPFQVDLTRLARPGKNTLTVRVTNLWPNRLVGDEQLAPDVEWNGIVLKQWPTWLTEGTPRESGRLTFTTWKHYSKDSPLLESGLIGPVVVRPTVVRSLELPTER